MSSDAPNTPINCAVKRNRTATHFETTTLFEFIVFFGKFLREEVRKEAGKARRSVPWGAVNESEEDKTCKLGLVLLLVVASLFSRLQFHTWEITISVLYYLFTPSRPAKVKPSAIYLIYFLAKITSNPLPQSRLNYLLLDPGSFSLRSSLSTTNRPDQDGRILETNP